MFQDGSRSLLRDKGRSLRRSPYLVHTTQNRRRLVFSWTQRRSRDVGRPGLARTSYIQVYKVASTSMASENSRTRDGRRRKNRPRGTVLLICCFLPIKESKELRLPLKQFVFQVIHQYRTQWSGYQYCHHRSGQHQRAASKAFGQSNRPNRCLNGRLREIRNDDI